MIRLIASDIDGTLIPIGGKMSHRTALAIRNAIDAGIIFVPASGRSLLGAAEPFKAMGIDCPVISCNGGRIDAHIYSSPVFEDCISHEQSKIICDILLDAGCFMTSYTANKVYVLPEVNGFGSTCAKVSEVAQEKFNYEDARREMLELGRIKPYKYEAYSDDKALLNQLRARFTEMGLNVAGAFEFNLEIMAQGAGKGRALKFLADKLNIGKSEIMALGDGSNDISLLEQAEIRVAMQNANEDVKAVASIIAPDAKDDGAAQIIEQMLRDR